MQCLEMAEENNLPVVAHLFEKDKYCNKQLRKTMGDYTLLFECHEYADFTENIMHGIMDKGKRGLKRLGLLLMDFNGLPDFDVLEILTNRSSMERIDILLNVSLSALKRSSGVKKVPNRHSGKTIHDYLVKIDKKNIVYKGPRKGRHNWILLYLTNGPTIDWKKEGWKKYDRNNVDW